MYNSSSFFSESEDLSTKVSSLRDICHKAGLLAIAATDKIKDLAKQLDNLKRNCVEKDAPLCDTLNTNSLHIMMKFDSVSTTNNCIVVFETTYENVNGNIV